jgi:hypothetical protein
MWERVWGWKLTLPSELLFWELESQWILEPLESDCRGQNTLHWKVFYIIGKLLKCRCLKWVCMTHLDICNTSYGKKKGQESNWQFDSQPQNVGNWLDFCVCSGMRYIVGKLLTKATTLFQTSFWSKVWTRSYSSAKLREFQPWQFRVSLSRVLGQKVIWM